MQMVLCIFKKKVSHALSGSVSQTICGKFGNSNCNFTRFTVPHHLLQQLLLCVIDAYCLRLLTLKKFSILQTKLKSNRMNCASEEPVKRRFWPSFQADKHFFRRQDLPWDDACHASKDENHASTKEYL